MNNLIRYYKIHILKRDDDNMDNYKAFTLVMLVWTIGEFVSKKTQAIISSLFVAAILFLVGFQSGVFPKTLLVDSALLPLGQAVLGMILVHIGTMISLTELKKQWKTVVIGVSAIAGVIVIVFTFGHLVFDGIPYMIAVVGAITGGTISIVIVQDAALEHGLPSVAVLPVLVAAFQGLIGFPLSSIILKKEAQSVLAKFRSGEIKLEVEDETKETKKLVPQLPALFNTTPGALFAVGVAVIISAYLSDLTNGIVNKFVITLFMGVFLREIGLFRKNILDGINAFGLMMLGLMIIIFGPLATLSTDDLVNLLEPLIFAFVLGVSGLMIFAAIVGKIIGYSIPMSIAVGLTALYGFPGTMILSQEAAKNVGTTEEEVQVIENNILPKMIIAGFATVTITSVVATSLLISYWTR